MSLRLPDAEQHSRSAQRPPCSLLEAVAAEVGYRRLARSLYTGPCPNCGADALAWDWRHAQPRDSFRCLNCDERGSLYRLSRLARERAA